MLKTGIFNLLVRGLTLASKFVLVLYIARLMTPADLGVFGLFIVSITISLVFLGTDFYIYNTREILAVDGNDFSHYLRDQAIYHLLVYILAIPLTLGFFFVGVLSWKMAAWFYAILILNHVSQELFRLLIILSKPVHANFIQFLQSGSWAYVVIALGLYDDSFRSINVFWAGWFVGTLISVLWAIYFLRGYEYKLYRERKIDWDWIRHGFKVSFPFFIATLAILGIHYADRYFLKLYYGEATVGIYTFFANIANVLPIFVFTGVAAILYPKMIASFQQGKIDEYRARMRKMMLGTISGTVVVGIMMMLAIKPVLYLVGKEVYANEITVFWILIGSSAMLALSYIPHYGLFVRQRDKQMIVATVIATVVAVIGHRIFVPTYGLHGAAFVSMTAMATMAGLKAYHHFRFRSQTTLDDATPPVDPETVIDPEYGSENWQ